MRTRSSHVAFELLALQVGGLVGALQLGAAQELVGVQVAYPQVLRSGLPRARARAARAGQAFAFHFHANAPLRQT